MTSKNQLQSKIEELEAQLQEFKKQLNNYKEVTIENASVGDVLDDGSIVLKKSNGLALLVAPKSTEVKCSWSKEFTEVFNKLEEHGFNPSQWFVPTKEQLLVAYNTIPNEFSTTAYWSSTEVIATYGCFVGFSTGNTGNCNKAYSFCVRAFRCVTY
tara:strand:- start:21 stop:488 length:468 start_codon:yes stop_codon:yes gene_type:complete